MSLLDFLKPEEKPINIPDKNISTLSYSTPVPDKNTEETVVVSVDSPEKETVKPEENKDVKPTVEVVKTKKPKIVVVTPVKSAPKPKIKTRKCSEKTVVFRDIEAITYKGHGKSIFGWKYAYMYRDVFQVVLSVSSDCQKSTKWNSSGLKYWGWEYITNLSHVRYKYKKTYYYNESTLDKVLKSEVTVNEIKE